MVTQSWKTDRVCLKRRIKSTLGCELAVNCFSEEPEESRQLVFTYFSVSGFGGEGESNVAEAR